MKTLYWQTLGWKITRKLVFYAIMFMVFTVMIVGSCSLMNIASTFAFFSGLIGIAFTVGVFISFLIREVLFYRRAFTEEQTNTNKYETND